MTGTVLFGREGNLLVAIRAEETNDDRLAHGWGKTANLDVFGKGNSRLILTAVSFFTCVCVCDLSFIPFSLCF